MKKTENRKAGWAGFIIFAVILVGIVYLMTRCGGTC